MILKSRGGCCWYLHSAEEESKAAEGDDRRPVPRRVPGCHDLKNVSHNHRRRQRMNGRHCGVSALQQARDSGALTYISRCGVAVAEVP